VAGVRWAGHPARLLREETTLYNAVEFERVATDGDTVFIVPAQVVKVQRWETEEGPYDSVIVLTQGDPEIVKGPPSEINRRLRSGQ
jgi:hypothetical protein